jgi:hypothetical protein
MKRIRVLCSALAFLAVVGSPVLSNAAPPAPEAHRLPRGDAQFGFIDSSLVVAPVARGNQTPGTRDDSAYPSNGLMRISEPSFSEVARGAPGPGLYATPTPTGYFPESPPKSWGHILAGIGMIAFVALRRSASL